MRRYSRPRPGSVPDPAPRQRNPEPPASSPAEGVRPCRTAPVGEDAPGQITPGRWIRTGRRGHRAVRRSPRARNIRVGSGGQQCRDDAGMVPARGGAQRQSFIVAPAAEMWIGAVCRQQAYRFGGALYRCPVKGSGSVFVRLVGVPPASSSPRTRPVPADETAAKRSVTSPSEPLGQPDIAARVGPGVAPAAGGDGLAWAV